MVDDKNEAGLPHSERDDKLPDFLYRKLVELIDNGAQPAAAIVVSAQGSTPQVEGARLVVEPSGRFWGTVGGGRFEAEVRTAAMEACRSQRAILFEFPMNNSDAMIEAPVCGGCMRVLVDPSPARHRDCFEQAALAVERRRRGLLLTRIKVNPQAEVELQWLTEDAIFRYGRFPGSLLLGACLNTGLPRAYIIEPAGDECGEVVFAEPTLPRSLLVVVGGGHVGHAVAVNASRVGFDVVVIDDRPEFASRSLYPPEIRTMCGPVADQISSCSPAENGFVVLVSRNHRQDAAALAATIHRPLAYLGMIGSRRKVALMRKHFLETGLATAEEFDRMHAPIGLDIGAITVPEIAVSIVAQLIAVRRKANPK